MIISRLDAGKEQRWLQFIPDTGVTVQAMVSHSTQGFLFLKLPM